MIPKEQILQIISEVFDIDMVDIRRHKGLPIKVRYAIRHFLRTHTIFTDTEISKQLELASPVHVADATVKWTKIIVKDDDMLYKDAMVKKAIGNYKAIKN